MESSYNWLLAGHTGAKQMKSGELNWKDTQSVLVSYVTTAPLPLWVCGLCTEAL